MGVSNVPAASAAGLQPKYQKFTSSGTFTLPTGYGAAKPLLIDIQVIGGGGGGAAEFVTANNGNSLGNVSYNNYFGSGTVATITGTAVNYTSTNYNGKGGGSGGLAKTQMYLTSNLTITVGAAGTRANNTFTYTTSNNLLRNNYRFAFGIVNFNASGGTGGTSTAGSVSAVGGTGGTTNVTIGAPQVNGATGGNIASIFNGETVDAGAGGTPAGTTGDATPLLGTIAGGSGNATPVYGSFGIGGKKTDGSTSTGVEGTGGGFGSIGASGAVIITWWE